MRWRNPKEHQNRMHPAESAAKALEMSQQTIKDEITNEGFSKENGTFIMACEKVGLPPTSRQASKWRNKTGKAYKESHHLN